MSKYLSAIQLNKGTFQINLLYKPHKKIKIGVSKNNNIDYYNINDQIIVPIYYGKGQYFISLYENVLNKQYSLKERIKINVNNDDTNYKLFSNSYVLYDKNSSFYNFALELQTIDSIYNYIINNIQYDFIAALSAKKNQLLPNPDQCFITKKGICQDIAALMVAMLRINNIESNLVIGYANNIYHAWVIVNNVLYDPTKVILKNTKKIKYLTDRIY